MLYQSFPFESVKESEQVPTLGGRDIIGTLPVSHVNIHGHGAREFASGDIREEEAKRKGLFTLPKICSR